MLEDSFDCVILVNKQFAKSSKEKVNSESGLYYH